MMDKKISMRFVAAYAAWAVAVGLWAVSWICSQVHLGLLALIVCAAAATSTVALHSRERAAELHNALTVVVGAEPWRRDRVRPLR